MSRRKKKRGHSEVELNLAAMLDMAFQLLTFFILTFRPAPIEGQVLLRMPPPQPVTGAGKMAAGSNPENFDPAQALDTLVITAIGNSQGTIRQLAVGDVTMGTLPALERKLQSVLGDPSTGFEQVIIQVDPNLRYEELMQVVDMCTRQKLPNGEPLSKLSFVELGGGG
jgi:biopolymer transport protein ExbD